MKRLRVWLPITLGLCVGIYFLVTSLGPEAEKAGTVRPTRVEETQEDQGEPESRQTPGEEDSGSDVGAGDTADTGWRVIGGTILGLDEEPLADAEVILLYDDGAEVTSLSTRTDGTGRFRFKAIPRSTLYLFLLRTRESPAWPLKWIEASSEEWDGSLEEMEFKPRLAEGRSLSAEVRNADGQPIADVLIELLFGPNYVAYVEHLPVLGGTVETDERGAATIRDLQPETYHLRASGEGLATKVVDSISLGRPQVRPLVIILGPPGSITGQVLNADGRPIAGADVVCHTQERPYLHRRRPIATAQANADGGFAFPDMPGGKYVLIASASGFATDFVQNVRLVPGEESIACTITLEPAIELVGRVVDTDDDPIEGAIVHLCRSTMIMFRRADGGSHGEELELAEVTTDVDGTFRFKEAPSHQAKIWVEKEGYEHAKHYEPVRGEQPLMVVLNRVSSVTGIVTSAESGDPVNGATVKAVIVSGNSTRHDREKTDEHGRYTFTRLEPGKGTFTAHAPGLVTPSPVRATVRKGQTLELDLALEPSKPITGIVVDKETGQPIGGAKVATVTREEEVRSRRSMEESPIDDDFASDKAFRAVTDKHGAFTIPLKPPDMAAIHVRAEGYILARLDVKDTDLSKPLRVELDSGGVIAGQVLAPDGQPLGGVRVTCLGEIKRSSARGRPRFEGQYNFRQKFEERTDRSGSFRIAGLHPGRYTVAARHRKYVNAVHGPVELEADQRLQEITLALTEGGRISGTVVTEDGAPVEDAWVDFERQNAEGDQDHVPVQIRGYQYDDDEPTRTTEDGAYMSPPLPPGKYAVSVHTFGSGESEEQAVEVTVGQTVRDVIVTVKEGLTIAGKVVDAESNPVPEASIRARSSSSMRSTQTDEDGTFVLKGLSRTKHVISVSVEGFATATISRTPPASDVEIALTRGIAITGRVVDKQTQEPVESYALQVYQPSVEDEYDVGRRTPDEEHHPGGRFEEKGLVPGRCTISITSEGYAPATVEGIEIEEGVAPAEILIELTRGAMIVFHVTSAIDGRPVEGATLWPQDYWGGVQVGLETREEDRPATDADGTCAVEHLLPGRHKFVMVHDEFADKKITVRLGKGEERENVEVVLDMGLTLRGLVVARADQAPVEGAAVTLRTQGVPVFFADQEGDFSAKTDAPGAFTLERVVPGRYTISVSHDDYAPFQQKQQFGNTFSDELLVELTSGGRIVGTVTTHTGLPVAQATVSLMGLLGAERHAKTDAQGNYEIAYVAPGSHRVMATFKSYQEPLEREGVADMKRAVVREGQDTRLDFVLGGGAAVYGTVTRNGEPVTGIQLNAVPKMTSLTPLLGTASSVTDEQGQYRIEGLRPRTYTLLITIGESGAGRVLHRKFQVGAEDLLFDIELGGGRVAGVVYDESGRSAGGVNLSLLPEIEQEGGASVFFSLATMGGSAAQTDENGAFAIPDVAGGTYRLYVGKPGYAVQCLTVQKGADRDVSDLVIHLEKETVVVGRPRTEDGKIPEQVLVAASDEKGRLLTINSFASDPDTGEFRIAGLGSGNFRITVQASGYAPLRTKVTVTRGVEASLPLNFKKGKDLTITVVDRSGTPVPGAQVFLDSGEDPLISAALAYSLLFGEGDMDLLKGTSAEGTMTLRHLADGGYTLHVRCEDYEEGNVPVRIAGSDEDVTVTLRPRGE